MNSPNRFKQGSPGSTRHATGPMPSPRARGYLVEVCRTAGLDHCSTVTMTIATARAVSNTRQNSARERTTTRLVR
jgi:hypothetical protein